MLFTFNNSFYFQVLFYKLFSLRKFQVTISFLFFYLRFLLLCSLHCYCCTRSHCLCVCFLRCFLLFRFCFFWFFIFHLWKNNFLKLWTCNFFGKRLSPLIDICLLCVHLCEFGLCTYIYYLSFAVSALF